MNREFFYFWNRENSGTAQNQYKCWTKQKLDNRAKVELDLAFVPIQFHFLSSVVQLSPLQIHPGLSYTFLTFFSHFVCTYNICTIYGRPIPVVEIPSTLFQGCFITKTSEVNEPHWDIRGTKHSVSWKRGWMISQLSARDCGVFNVPSWCINWTPPSSVMNLYSSHIWWVWPL